MTRASPPPAEDLVPLRRRLRMLGVVLAGLVLLAIAWSWSPMRAWLDVDRIVDGLQSVGESFGPVAAIAGFTVAVTLAVPLSFLMLVTFVAFGPWAGMVYCLVGGLLGAAASHGVGRLLGREAVQRLGGPRVRSIAERLSHHGLLAVIAIRVVPVAPFAIVNMVAGAAHVRLRHMLLGTAIGMAPSTLVMAFFVDQIVAALRTPGPLTYALLALTVLLIASAAWGARRWVAHVEAERLGQGRGRATESG